MIALDTNLLIYAHRSAVREHTAARRAIERASRDRRGWGFTLGSAVEFWSVVTHPDAGGRASTPEEARAFLKNLTLAGAAVWTPQAGLWERLTQAAADLDVRGARVFDLQIALTAADHGAAEIWTHDRSFVSIPGLRVHDPL